MKFDKKSLLLYAVTDRHWLQGRTLYEAVEQALKGGVSFLQVREKDDMRLSHDEYLKEALQLRDLCRRYQVPFVIDDDVDLALETDADGVHVGQNDMEAGNVREKLGPDKILGVSAHTVKEALLAQERGADYLGVGAVFPTGSKDDAEQVDRAVLSEICRAVDIPVIAIGGITRDNVLSLSGTGIAGIAVISAIFAKNDIQAAARDLRSQTLQAVNREVNL
ncbi:MAG: thiamine phosphate synthase [Lachnospiraceae bacterium]|jgi:thiamine-phosphate pyrophosphorylase|nr:thiamine phosphate synthase [Lachnospiraceae bacterium]MCI1657161.1 thiamine phosphate synthase [Lachnospiraceae bacterium]MCI2195622.1 thiamine phosphate synthase [Lachnospiraceae bacterium]